MCQNHVFYTAPFMKQRWETLSVETFDHLFHQPCVNLPLQRPLLVSDRY